MALKLVQPGAEQISLQVAGSFTELPRLRDFVNGAVKRMTKGRMRKTDHDAVMLAVTETVTNVIRHGLRPTHDPIMQCLAAIEHDYLCISIYHSGLPFTPPATQELEEPTEGGMGLFIISKCVDVVDYATADDRTQCIRLKKKLTKGPTMDNTIEKIGDVLVFQVNYDALDAGSVSDFKSDLAEIVENGANIVLDLTNVEYVDSAGLGGIVSVLKQLRDNNGEIKIFGLQGRVRALFELVRMHKLIDLCNTQEEAIRSFEE